jgi:predicted N-acetyltransferase YhbS
MVNMRRIKPEIIKLNQKELKSVYQLLITLTNDEFEVIKSADGDVCYNGLMNELHLKTEYPNVLVIGNIFLAEPGKGIGTQILNALHDFAKAKGFKEIVLESAVTDACHRFAKKHGFKTIDALDWKKAV